MAASVKAKHLWRGAFNFFKTVNILYAYAYTEKQAKVIMCQRLAKQQEVHPGMVMNLFDGSQDNYEIKIETEFKENEG